MLLKMKPIVLRETRRTGTPVIKNTLDSKIQMGLVQKTDRTDKELDTVYKDLSGKLIELELDRTSKLDNYQSIVHKMIDILERLQSIFYAMRSTMQTKYLAAKKYPISKYTVIHVI